MPGLALDRLREERKAQEMSCVGKREEKKFGELVTNI